MEEGSLLAEALRYQREQANASSESSSDKHNAVLLDVYSLNIIHNTNDSNDDGSKQKNAHIISNQLLQYAQLASQCNTFLRTHTPKLFSWFIGGDGPVFGIHVTDGIPHLRAICKYGSNIHDEWMAIGLVHELSRQHPELLVACWDLDDGQVILVEMANHIPDDFDQDSTDHHRHACWMHQGKVQLLSQPHITLPNALATLSQKQPSGDKHISIPQLNQDLQAWIHKTRQQATLAHRTALVLPRSIAKLLERRPDLMNTAVHAFCQHAVHQPPPPDFFTAKYQDWVWTKHSISRTNFAMARTIVSPQWEAASTMPRPLSIEMKRYQRQCNMEGTAPYLQHAVELGVRVTVGLDYILSNTAATGQHQQASIDQRVANWTVMSKECTIPTAQAQYDPNWVVAAFRQGPNQAEINIEALLKCPVFFEEKDNLTLHSHPETSVAQQVRTAMKFDDEEEDEYLMPRGPDIDTDESWMNLESELLSKTTKQEVPPTDEGNELNEILDKFKSFMGQSSEFDGVGSQTVDKTDSKQQPPDKQQPPETAKRAFNINPRAVLNIVHTVLTADKEELVFPSADPFFFSEDFDLMDQDDEDEGFENEVVDDETSNDPSTLKGMMKAMDEELQARSESRGLDRPEGISEEEDGEDDVAENAHVLKNLVESMEATSGSTGPANNMLTEIETRKLP